MTVKITVYGLVQGVGFRPYVKAVADKFNLKGNVKNIGGIVEIFINADNKILDEFVQYLIYHKPIGCRIYKTLTEIVPDKKFNAFNIIKSNDCDVIPVIPSDIGICEKCMAEFKDSNNPRYNHPLRSCVSCGPRYSIIKSLPYDRINTAMDIFPMCSFCEDEYNKKENRRCYAQTIACNSCGPALCYTRDGDPLKEAIKDIKNGSVIAIKDIGGFHFVCDANNKMAIEKLRNLKIREEKPFAVMFYNIAQIDSYATVSDLEKEVLLSDQRPIVLVRKNYKNNFPENLCKDSNDIGAFLPCNSVQAKITMECGPVVMTSGNISGEPIITSDKKMLEIYNSSEFLEGVLYHNREILTPLDDSIVRVIANDVQLIRRGRGYTPLPLWLDFKTDKKIFASGGDLKASFCLIAENRAYMSQYFGDLIDADCFSSYKSNIKRMTEMFNINPDTFVCDMHPGYFSTKCTKGIADEPIYVQHHMAHIASVIAEHNIKGDVLGFAFDGTGYGTDGTIWGGEVFEYKNGEFDKKLNLKPIKMLGGEEISKNAETALKCYFWDAGIEFNDKLISSALKNNINTIKSSSMGRLFDAVSAMLGVCNYNTYEGKCAILLEICAGKSKNPYPLTLPLKNGQWDVADLIKQIAAAKSEVCDVALGFHYAVADAVSKVCEKANIKNIALSGGVFMNRILTELCMDKLQKKGYNVYINRQVPSNDGGVALGQAFLAGRMS